MSIRLFFLATLIYSLYIHSIRASLPKTNVFVFGTELSGLENLYSSITETKLSKTVKDIAAGKNHVLIRMSDDTLFGMGSHLRGQLGIGSLLGSAQWTSTPKNIPLQGTLISFDAKGDKSLVLTSDGVFVFGDSLYNEQKGFVTSPTKLQISTGTYTHLSVKAMSTAEFLVTTTHILGSGWNTNGELGESLSTLQKRLYLDQVYEINTPIQASTGAHFMVLLENDGSLIYWGTLGTLNVFTPTKVLSGDLLLHNIKLFAITANQLIYMTDSKTIYLSNDMQSSQQLILLEDFSASSDFSQITCTTTSLCSILNIQGDVYTISLNRDNRNFGHISSNINKEYSIYKNNLFNKVVHTASGTIFSKESSNSLFVLGKNEYGSLGQEVKAATPNPYSIIPKEESLSDGEFLKAVLVRSGKHHTMIIDDRGRLYGYGLNSYGELGPSIALITVQPEMLDFKHNCGFYYLKSVSVGERHTTLLDESGNVYAFGDSDRAFGVSGANFGECKQVSFPKPISQICSGADYSLALADDKKYVYIWGISPTTKNPIGPTIVNLGPSQRISKIICGGFHHVVQFEDNSYFCWGKNDFGQCNIQSTVPDIITPVKLTIPLNSGEYIAEAVAGYRHTLLYTSNGDVYGFGDNSQFQLSSSEKAIYDTVYYLSSLSNLKIDAMSTAYDTSTIIVPVDGDKKSLVFWGSLPDVSLRMKYSRKIINNPCTLSSVQSLEQSYERFYVICDSHTVNSNIPSWQIVLSIISIIVGLAICGFFICCGGSITSTLFDSLLQSRKSLTNPKTIIENEFYKDPFLEEELPDMSV